MRKFYLTSIIPFLLIGCSKDDTITEIHVEEDEEIINLAPYDFNIDINNVSHDSATISWNQATDPENDSVTYSVYLNQTLILEGVSELTHMFINLTELTDYTGKIIARDTNDNETSITFSFTTEKYYLKYLKTYDYGETNYGNGYASGSPYSIIKTSNQNYVIAGKSVRQNGNGFQFFVLKIDYEGNEVWRKVYDYEIGDDWNFKITELNDNGYILVGGPFVLRLDIEGNIIWDKRIDSYVDQSYNFLSTYGQLKSVKEDPNGNIFLVGGRCSCFDPEKYEEAVLTKLDNLGNIIWEKIFKPSVRNYFFDIIINSTNELLILGSKETSGNNTVSTLESSEQIDFWVLKIDIEGNIIWENTFGDGGYDFPSQIIFKSNGNYVFTGYSWGAYDISGGKIFEISTEGNEILNVSTELSSTFSIAETLDGGFITTGHVDFGNYGALGIFKFDSSGNKEWDQRYQESFAYLRGRSIITEEDGGYRIAGSYDKNFYYDEDKPKLLIYKTDPNGNYE